jgi:hypothetical protein
MINLMITVMAIALQATALYCMLQYTPSWAKAAPDYARLMAASLSDFEGAFYRYGSANGGLMPQPTAAIDGGLSQFQSPGRYLPFLPKAPAGFYWKYGRLASPSTAYYVCLQSVSTTQPMDAALFYGIRRLTRLLPTGQLVISDGSQSCGSTSDISAAPGNLPKPLSVTFFMRYSEGGIQSTEAFPCRGNKCMSPSAI